MKNYLTRQKNFVETTPSDVQEMLGRNNINQLQFSQGITVGENNYEKEAIQHYLKAFLFFFIVMSILCLLLYLKHNKVNLNSIKQEKKTSK
ncbi:hypothetical protein EDEG_05082 [Edhazardia aedis USNM 41457]|uniref:Uncharacterized protein n=1 Tax=Edhazardia aedis (strain USNM 41457) TaxID=1003232 RepID=A0A0L1P7B3_EDHAE|nr:hypothetical protein EDEG_05082 [Edhazardia aedis USNM 41457]|eukprot:KNH48534.1 hypothetical protein EDEG_05082 [Edhazardia aedis USNM 41457]